ncbi:SDR family NAD(P)-dependent oxidoreductase [Lonepinella sp. MS14437]|uniref:SDR family NAD(P)-dependent oxidoreductase n=1 Tax=Lonepinella sp. MS14437 TaxID=3003620 RepID=UPI0036DE1534
MQKTRILVVGGTSTISEYCLREWVKKQDCDVILLGRNKEKLQLVTSDLQVRSPNSTFESHVVDFTNPTDIHNVISDIFTKGRIDIALIAHGILPDQEALQIDVAKNKASLEINGISPVLFAEEIVNYMLKENYGSLGIIGSVAGDRGRKSNYIYGSAKAMIDKYIQGMQHRLALANSKVKVSLIKPGPTKTTMTQSITGKGKMAEPKQVALDIVSGMQKGKRVIYTPKKWALIMTVVKHIPMFLFRKIDI